MSTAVTTPRTHRDGLRRGGGRRPAQQERRRLARQDVVAARLAELHHIRALLREAEVVVSAGWVQNAWFAVRGTRGEVAVTAHDLHLLADGPVSGACLVGGIVHAAGGPAAVHTQLVQRTLDLTWHALAEDDRRPVRWCPAPDVRAAHVRDLTRWNDQPRRTAEDVVSLLRSAVATADAEIGLCRARA